MQLLTVQLLCGLGQAAPLSVFICKRMGLAPLSESLPALTTYRVIRISVLFSELGPRARHWDQPFTHTSSSTPLNLPAPWVSWGPHFTLEETEALRGVTGARGHT